MLDRLSAYKRRLTFQLEDLISSTNGLHLHLSNSQVSISLATIDFLRCWCDRYLDFLSSLAGQAFSIDSDVTSLTARAQDGR